jgi:DNA-binding response OmpR family regulator
VIGKELLVLLVDDEEQDLTRTSAALRANGFQVVKACNYDTAMGVFAVHREDIDVLIADISLPGRNGCELALSILNAKPDVKVLFISGHTGAEVVRFYGLSISDILFLRKPFEPAALIARLNQVLASTEKLAGLSRAAGQALENGG